MRKLSKFAKIQPQLVQNNVWSFMFDPRLMDFLHEHKIHFQAYNVFGGIMQDVSSSARIQAVAESLAGTPTQVVLRWLMQRNVSVVPRSSQSAHLAENSGAAKLPSLDEVQMKDIAKEVQGLMRAGSRPR